MLPQRYQGFYTFLSFILVVIGTTAVVVVVGVAVVLACVLTLVVVGCLRRLRSGRVRGSGSNGSGGIVPDSVVVVCHIYTYNSYTHLKAYAESVFDFIACPGSSHHIVFACRSFRLGECCCAWVEEEEELCKDAGRQ